MPRAERRPARSRRRRLRLDPVAVDAVAEGGDPDCALEHTHGCSDDAECAKGAVCERSWFASCTCNAKCMTDSDCGVGSVCVPTVASGANECHPAECRSDSDCASGYCVVWRGPCGTVGGLQCFTPDDECRTTADCAPSDDVCRPAGGGFQCGQTNETCE